MMNKIETTTISKSLGIEVKQEQEILPPEKKVEPVVIEPTNNSNDDANADYDLSRRTFRDLIEKGNDAIDELFSLAKTSEHPRAYEVLGTLIKTVADTTNNLYDLQKKSKELNKKPSDATDTSGSVTVQKAVFVGSTTELLRKIKEEKEK
jgi:hypothetical protein